MLSQEIYKPFGLEGYASNLKEEFDAQPLGIKIKWWRGILSRELMLWLSGQKFLQKKNFVLKNRPRILWVYDGLSMGDCIMDLSQRGILALHADVDLCIPRAPRRLFDHDPAFKNVVISPNECIGNYDLILLHNISTSSIRLKRRFFPKAPFASMLEHQQGEMYDRITYTWCRLNQFFDLCDADGVKMPKRPTLKLIYNEANVPSSICVALGSVDRRRCYNSWPEVLQQIVDAWPISMIAPRFTLVGSGESAQKALAGFSLEFIDRYCECVFDVADIAELCKTIARAQYYLGVDGGVMHMAEALDKPGLAIFAAGVRPEWRLLKTSRLETIDAGIAVNSLQAKTIANKFINLLT